MQSTFCQKIKMNSWPGLGQFDGWLSSVVSLTFAMYQIKRARNKISFTENEMLWLNTSLTWQYLQCNWLHCNCDAFFKTSRLHMIARCKSQHLDGLYWLFLVWHLALEKYLKNTTTMSFLLHHLISVAESASKGIHLIQQSFPRIEFNLSFIWRGTGNSI